jgi:hypothetical protein
VRCFLGTQLLQFLIRQAGVDDHDTLQPSAQRLSERTVLLRTETQGERIRLMVVQEMEETNNKAERRDLEVMRD